LPCSGLVKLSEEILNIGKSHKKKPDGLFPHDDLAMKLLTLLFADNYVLISITEDKLQKAVYKLNQITPEHGSIIPTQTTKMMTFKGRNPVRSKT
jgi:hypothetical protein